MLIRCRVAPSPGGRIGWVEGEYMGDRSELVILSGGFLRHGYGWRFFGWIIFGGLLWAVCYDTKNLNETESETFSDTESDTFFDTKYFPYRIRYFFRYQIISDTESDTFSIQICFDTESDTIQKIGTVLKPRSFKTEMSHSGWHFHELC